MTTTTVIEPGETVTLDAREGGGTIRVINSSSTAASYRVSIDGGAPQDGQIPPGSSNTITFNDAGTATITNTGSVPIEAEFF